MRLFAFARTLETEHQTQPTTIREKRKLNQPYKIVCVWVVWPLFAQIQTHICLEEPESALSTDRTSFHEAANGSARHGHAEGDRA